MSRSPRSLVARKDWGKDDSATPIMHIDMDAFFVSIELLDKPHLRGLPVAVGGQDRGVISTASYEARVFGVNSAMPVVQAKRLCPQLIILPSDGEKYRAASHVIMEYLRSVTPLVEQISVDEAFLDVHGAKKMFGSPLRIAHMIRREIRARVGVPASVGIGNTKHIAKIASAHAKPDGVLLIPAQASIAFLHSLPVGALWGVGDKTCQILHNHGVQTIGDVAALGERRLIHILGASAGSHIYALSMNHDERAVCTEREEKSMSKERTFFDPLLSIDAVEKEILAQTYDLGRRLRSAHMKTSTVSIKLRSTAFHTVSRSATLPVPTNESREIYDVAQRLIRCVDFPRGGVRLVGVRAATLVPERCDYQLAFGDDGRRGRIDQALDAVYARFGGPIAGPGTLVASSADRAVKNS